MYYSVIFDECGSIVAYVSDWTDSDIDNHLEMYPEHRLGTSYELLDDECYF